MRRLVAIAMLGCGGGNPPPQELHPTLEAAPPDARHNDASDDVNAVAKQLAPLSARRPTPNIPPELHGVPFYVRDVEGLMLFEDEQATAAAAIAAWARGTNLTVEEPSRTRELIDRAKLGEHAVTGAACGAPLSQDRAAVRWNKELKARGRIQARIQCTPECSLIVTVAQGVESAAPGPAAFFAAPYDVTRPWRSELVHALAQLVDALDAKRSAAGATEPGSPADLAADAPPAPPLFGIELRDRVAHCIPAGDSVDVLVDLDPAGKVTRCEGDAYRGDRALASCACSDLANQTFSDAKGRRRGVASFTGKQGPVTTKRGARVHATLVATGDADPLITGWAPHDGRSVPVEQCFATESDPLPFEASVAFDFDATGTATKVTLAGAKPLRPLESCIVTALKTIHAPCPEGATTAQGRLAITFDKP
jgi:hypothetical protein